jgi:hypothetical protein
MESYSQEFRRDVFAACDAGGGTREVALRFRVSESWVRRIKLERREQGKLAPQTHRNRRKAGNRMPRGSWPSWTSGPISTCVDCRWRPRKSSVGRSRTSRFRERVERCG